MSPGAATVDIYLPPSLTSARLSSRTFTPGSPKRPSQRPSVFSLISFWTVASGRWRTAATRCACSCAYASEISGIDPGRRRHDRVDRDLVDRQARVVGPLELEHGVGVLLHELRERRVRRAEVRERRAAPRCRRETSPTAARGRLRATRTPAPRASSRRPCRGSGSGCPSRLARERDLTRSPVITTRIREAEERAS